MLQGRYRESDRRYQSARDARKIGLTGSPMENIGRFSKVVAARKPWNGRHEKMDAM
jgi:hypothetical protein